MKTNPGLLVQVLLFAMTTVSCSGNNGENSCTVDVSSEDPSNIGTVDVSLTTIDCPGTRNETDEEGITRIIGPETTFSIYHENGSLIATGCDQETPALELPLGRYRFQPTDVEGCVTPKDFYVDFQFSKVMKIEADYRPVDWQFEEYPYSWLSIGIAPPVISYTLFDDAYSDITDHTAEGYDNCYDLPIDENFGLFLEHEDPSGSHMTLFNSAGYTILWIGNY
jgi:hypothetical protein